jgi:hypothetical protein
MLHAIRWKREFVAVTINRTEPGDPGLDTDLLRDPIPWDDGAFLVRRPHLRPSTIDGVGSLYAMVLRLQAISDQDWRLYRITLPNRNRLPLKYFPKQFGALIRQSYWA